MAKQVKERTTLSGEQQGPSHALFHVYEDEIFLGKRFFSDGNLSIGSSRKADILLNHRSVEKIHAVVHLEGDRVILKNNYPDDGLKVNGLLVESVPLRSRDVINIGPYDIHVEIHITDEMSAGKPAPGAPSAPKPKPRRHTTTEKPITLKTAPSCKLVLANRYPSAQARQHAAKQLAKLFKQNDKTWLSLLSKELLVIKEDLDQDTARRWQERLQSAGIFCLVEQVGSLAAPAPTEPIAPASDDIALDEVIQETIILHETDTAPDLAPPPYRFSAQEEVDEDDEEEALWIAPFSLKSKLDAPPPSTAIPKHSPKQLAIIKHIGPAVADVTHLTGGETYAVAAENGSRRLARYTTKGLGHVYFAQAMHGFIKYTDQTTVDLDQYKQDSHVYSRRKALYRLSVPEDATVVIGDGETTYTLCYTAARALPDLKKDAGPKSLTWRHWATSLGLHLAMILVASMIYYFQATAPVVQQPRFVKIDPTLLKQLETKKIEKPKPKKTPPPPQPEPQRLARKAEPVKKKVKPRPASHSTAAKKHNKKVHSAKRPSKHPKAGGGFGKGNIKNRDIKQTGLLSLLGNSTIAGPSKAIASITNLDAVPSPGATQKNYTVGGIKGSLGTGKIAVSNDTILQTKGSTQMLRSAGASGPGRVAALQKGKTGKKQVMAMVTAKMTRKVKIEGGMSREAVKQVIDQHLDEITQCYETALLSNPSISGRVVFEWKILMSGRVGEINIVASNINSHEIHACIKTAIKRWTFPRPKGTEVVVSYPFVFDLVAF